MSLNKQFNFTVQIYINYYDSKTKVNNVHAEYKTYNNANKEKQ